MREENAMEARLRDVEVDGDEWSTIEARDCDDY